MAPIRSIAFRFRTIVMQEDGCWRWGGRTAADGYGALDHLNQSVQAHRWFYELLVGEIPDGLVLDHLCRNRACVNPDHLEPVTNLENVRRGISFAVTNRAKTHCDSGHLFDQANTYIRPTGFRACRKCNLRAVSEYKRRKTGAA